MRLGCLIKLNGQALDLMMAEAPNSNGEHIWEGAIDFAPGVTFRLVSRADGKTCVTCRRLEIANGGAEPVTLNAAHIRYELNYPHAHLSYFTSDWGSEYSPVELDVTYDVMISTSTGRSSKGCCPFFRVSSVTGRKMLGVSVGWSGNWQADVNRDSSRGVNVVTVGLYEKAFAHVILPGEAFENIEIYDAYADDDDWDALSDRFRRYYRRNIRLLPEGQTSMPFTYNPWWPYEDKWIGEDAFFKNAQRAKELGITHAVLDAGWFGPNEVPDPDKTMPWFLKRGDWALENATLFPSGIAALGRRTNESGISFGIWCEIEAVGEEAELNRTHPELIARRDGKSLGHVCMGSPAARAWAMGIVERLVEGYGAKWIKFDFNLDPGLGCDCEEHGHGAGDGLWAHYRGYYRFLDEVRARWPQVLLENCSSGGLRIDYGLMKHLHVLYLSDPDYTRHHLQCFWGALSHIHPSALYHFTQSHVVGDHNVGFDDEGRRTPVRVPIDADTPMNTLDYMVRACMPGLPGLSLKLVELPDAALQRLRELIGFYNKNATEFVLWGDIWRLTPQTRSTPGGGSESWCAFQQRSARGDRSLMYVFKSDNQKSRTVIRLRGLNPDAVYALRFHNEGEERRATGRALMEEGLAFEAKEKMWSNLVEIENADAKA